MKILLNRFDEAERLSMEIGDWVVAVIETQIFWPKKKQTASYEGKEFVLLPLGEPSGPFATRQLPAIALRADTYGLPRAEARRKIMQFASALSWREGAKIEIVSWSGGNIPRSLGIIRNNAVTDYLDSEHLPSSEDERARAALAFYREGISLDNPFYAFLSLYKAFSVAISDGRVRGQWMSDKRGEIGDEEAKKRLTELDREGVNIGDYLYQKGRHAIAHADREPFVNPDDADDHFRLSLDLPLMRKFSELAIEEQFGIKRRDTIYREHLYELEGFRKLVPSEIVKRFKGGDGVDASFEIELPEQFVLVAQKGANQYALDGMKVGLAGCFEHGIAIDFESPHATVALRVSLNFADEKLMFDPVRHFSITSKREEKNAIREEVRALQFLRCILSNGHIEIWDPAGKRLGCSEGYIPVNCFVNNDYFEQQLRDLENLLQQQSAGLAKG